MAFCASGTGVDLQVGPVHVLLFAEHVLQLQIFDQPEGLAILAVHLFLAGFPLIIEVLVYTELFQVGLDLVESLGPFLQVGDVFEFFFRGLGIIPEIRVLGFLFFFFDTYLQVIDVKDTSSARRGALRFAGCLLLRS